MTYYYHELFPGALPLGARRDPAGAPITLWINFRYHKFSSRTYWGNLCRTRAGKLIINFVIIRIYPGNLDFGNLEAGPHLDLLILIFISSGSVIEKAYFVNPGMGGGVRPSPDPLRTGQTLFRKLHSVCPKYISDHFRRKTRGTSVP